MILTDGSEFARLMIEHDVGVRLARRVDVKRIDEDFFAENWPKVAELNGPNAFSATNSPRINGLFAGASSKLQRLWLASANNAVKFIDATARGAEVGKRLGPTQAPSLTGAIARRGRRDAQKGQQAG
ncbi:hypothetical protein [Acidibrevibacterium fodinaquatile]|uniref:hypothetical protein n=1 Tax=Acidibrevibacterium fodinaquatile TaxID=1969806 RepID=UPI0013B3F051|nr:hypothetical protein [Acidibrevibacterium fodinaquatile]